MRILLALLIALTGCTMTAEAVRENPYVVMANGDSFCWAKNVPQHPYWLFCAPRQNIDSAASACGYSGDVETAFQIQIRECMAGKGLIALRVPRGPPSPKKTVSCKDYLPAEQCPSDGR